MFKAHIVSKSKWLNRSWPDPHSTDTYLRYNLRKFHISFELHRTFVEQSSLSFYYFRFIWGFYLWSALTLGFANPAAPHYLGYPKLWATLDWLLSPPVHSLTASDLNSSLKVLRFLTGFIASPNYTLIYWRALTLILFLPKSVSVIRGSPQIDYSLNLII